MINFYTGGFTDGNNTSVSAGDRVEYCYGQRTGVLQEALQDGDAYVLFDDTNMHECVKWRNLCKIPEENYKSKVTSDKFRQDINAQMENIKLEINIQLQMMQKIYASLETLEKTLAALERNHNERNTNNSRYKV